MSDLWGRTSRQSDKAGVSYSHFCYLLAAIVLVGVIAGCDGPQCLDGRSIEEDLDGDALPDCFEDGKGDIDGDGRADQVFAAPVSSGQKDIIIRYDWMDCGSSTTSACSDGHSHEPNLDALEDVRIAFRDSPVTNPDGSTGIRIHYERGGPIAHQEICDCACLENIVRDQQRLLTPDERADENASIIATVKEKLVHYVLFSHQRDRSGSSGVACASNGFTHVSLGGSQWIDPLTGAYGTREQQAGTLMHELGHQLGLGHGGVDDVNRKPNYLSVMNYTFQVNYIGRIGLDYSREKLPTLDKTSLDENFGIGIPASSNSTHLTRFFLPDLTESLWEPVAGSIDWDGSGSLSTVSQDINGNTICVTPGSDGELQTWKDPADVYVDHTGSGIMNMSSSLPVAPTDLSFPARGNPDRVRVFAGPDGVLDTARTEDATLRRFVIAAGEDEVCDTEPEDVKEDDFLSHHGIIRNLLHGHDDWSNLDLMKLFILKGGFGEEIPASLPEIEWHEPFTYQNVVRAYESDIEIQSSAQFYAKNRELSYEMNVLNNGPQEAKEGVTVTVRIPLTSSEISCSSSAGECAISTNTTHVLFLVPALAVGQKEVYNISMKVDSSLCDTPHSYDANIWTAIANVEVDHGNDRYDLRFPDQDADGIPDICIWPANQLGVYGMESVHLANRVEVRSASDWGIVASNGAMPLHLATDVQVGDVFANQDVFMANRALVHGNVVAGGRVEKQHGAIVSGDVEEGNSPRPQLPTLQITVDWPIGDAENIEVTRDSAHRLAPGFYDKITVFGGADLYLSPGDYYINRLQLEAQGRVHIAASEGEVRIFVREHLISRAEWIVNDDSEKNILLAYDGEGDMTFDTSFYGSILAPRSKVIFGSASGLLLKGAILARRVEIRPDVLVIHTPFIGKWPWNPKAQNGGE